MTVDSSTTGSGRETHPQMPRTGGTETTLSISTDSEPTNLPEDSRPTGALSTMATVEIVLGCFILLMFGGSLLLWVILCYKAKAMRRVRNLPSPITTDSERNRMHQPVYDSIYKMQESGNGSGTIVNFFHRNPAYAYQIEPKRTKKVVKIHHDWLIWLHHLLLHLLSACKITWCDFLLHCYDIVDFYSMSGSVYTICM